MERAVLRHTQVAAAAAARWVISVGFFAFAIGSWVERESCVDDDDRLRGRARSFLKVIHPVLIFAQGSTELAVVVVVRANMLYI